MCLDFDIHCEPFREGKTRLFWKVLVQYGSKLYSVFQKHNWLPGVNRSGRLTSLTEEERGNRAIELGIHVFTTREAAVAFVNGGNVHREVIVSVLCEDDDCVMIGHRNEAVYTKVTLEEKEYNRVLGI